MLYRKDLLFASGLIDRFKDSQAPPPEPATAPAQNPNEGMPSTLTAAAAGRSPFAVPTPSEEEGKRDRQQQRAGSGTPSVELVDSKGVEASPPGGSGISSDGELQDDRDVGFGGEQGPVSAGRPVYLPGLWPTGLVDLGIACSNARLYDCLM